MSEFIKTLFEEKEKLDEICHIEEQQRKKIQKHLDTLTDDQIREMSFEDKVLVNNPDLRLKPQRSELKKAHIDQPKCSEHSVVYAITPTDNPLVRSNCVGSVKVL